MAVKRRTLLSEKRMAMANVMRWEAMDDQLDNLVRSFFRPASVTTRDVVVPIRMDVSEKENAYVVHADMPGVKKEAVNLEFLDGQPLRFRRKIDGWVLWSVGLDLKDDWDGKTPPPVTD